MMKTTKILFTRESAIAYREGRKCRTQRVIRLPKWVGEDTAEAYHALIKNPAGFVEYGRCDGIKHQYKCPYGQPGDRLQLLTSWAVPKEYDEHKPSDLLGSDLHCEDIWTYFDSDQKPECLGRLRSPLFMPGWLRDVMPHPKILSLEARRLREITDEEAIEEGIIEAYPNMWSHRNVATRGQCLGNPRMAYANWINTIHGGSNWNYWYRGLGNHKMPMWESNTWVWNIKIEKLNS